MYFRADQYLQLAPQIPANSLSPDPGKGSNLYVDLDGDNYGDTGIDLDNDGRNDLAIWRPYNSYYGWYSENPTYTFRSSDTSTKGKYYIKKGLPAQQTFSLSSINQIAEEYDQEIIQQAAHQDITQTWGMFIYAFGDHYPQGGLNQAGVHWIFTDEGRSLIKFAVDPQNFKLYYSNKIDLTSVELESPNQMPTGITASKLLFDENIPAGSVVASFSTTDPDVGDTFSYSFVDDVDDTDNALFTIDGDQLIINDSPDFESKKFYFINVLTTDSGGQTFDKTFTLAVNDLEEGPTTVRSSTSYTLKLDEQNLNLTWKKPINGFGNELNNKITGNKARNIIDGKKGGDKMKGNDGDDVYYVDDKRDRVLEYADQGIDKVFSSITEQLSDNVENLTLTGTNAINGIGNNLDNIIIGNNAKNKIVGKEGRDIITGNRGKDKLTGGEDADRFVYTSIRDSGPARKKRDVITDFSSFEDQIDLSQIDADPLTSGNQPLVFIGSEKFSEAGQVRFNKGMLSVNIDGDLKSDMTILLNNVAELNLESLIL